MVVVVRRYRTVDVRNRECGCVEGRGRNRKTFQPPTKKSKQPTEVRGEGSGVEPTTNVSRELSGGEAKNHDKTIGKRSNKS